MKDKIDMLLAAGFSRAEIAQAILGTTTMCAPTGEVNAHALVGKHCIVRTRGAGVHAGIVRSIDGPAQVTLEPGSVRLWRWHTATGKGALSTLARVGLAHGKDNRVERNGGMVALRDVCEIGEVAQGVTFSEVWP